MKPYTAMVVILATFVLRSPLRAAGASLKALIVDGQNNHDWRATTPAMKAILEGSGRFAVDVATAPPRGASDKDWSNFTPDFAGHAVVLLNYYGQDWPAPVMDALERFVANGGGLVAVHAGGSSFEKDAAYNRMIGLAWRKADFGAGLAYDANGQLVRIESGEGRDSGHGQRVPFVVQTRSPRHPIMAGFPDCWTHASDELYYGLHGPAEEVEVLATALSPVTHLNEPIAWTVKYGRGRVFVTALGHDVPAMQCLGFRALLARGCEWAATGQVTLPVPADLPSGEATRAPASTQPIADAGPVAASAAPSHQAILSHIDRGVRMNGAYAAIKLPITKGIPLHNPTALAVGPDGHMYVANYTGQILRLDDTNGDGLEDTATLWADVTQDGKEYPIDDAKNWRGVPQQPGLRYPTALLFKGDDLYVATTQEIRIYTDSHHVGHADTSRTFATGWPFTLHYWDWTFGLRFGPDGYLYTILCTDYLNPHAAADPQGLRGSMLRISPDGKTWERYAYGLRFAYGMAFNEAGDLFCSDNEGGGNPTEEINYVIKGGNYGHHPKLANSPPIAPLLAITPHLSTDGIDFNFRANDFGGTAGDLFIACWGPDGRWERGGVLRARLEKQSDGSYKGNYFPFADGPGKCVDVRFGPGGDLYVARFGTEGPSHTPAPQPEGDVYRLIYAPWLRPGQYTGIDAASIAAANPLLKRQLVGDPIKGKIIATQRTCLTCHSTDGSTSSLGPDLTYIWRTMGHDGVLEAIKEPSKTIATGYDGYVLATRDGDVVSGRMLSSDEESVTLLTSEKRPRTFPRSQIKKLAMMSQSLMPEGLLAGLGDGEVNDLLAFLQSLSQQEPAVRIHVGGQAVKDDSGRTWEADHEYKPGGCGAVGGKVFETAEIADPLLRTCRYGDFSYRFDVDNGDYDATLVMAEPLLRDAGKRIFSVSIQGGTAIKYLDLVKEAGFGKALRRTFPARATDGKIIVDFSGSVNSALVCGIELRARTPASSTAQGFIQTNSPRP